MINVNAGERQHPIIYTNDIKKEMRFINVTIHSDSQKKFQEI